MKAYIFQAALLCEDCGLRAISELRMDGGTNAGDSGDFPQGPYANGGGESDCPQHCDRCSEFLQNPLTDEGHAYVANAVARDKARGYHNSIAIDEWSPFYNIG
jgi:hypothetical protein